jgi:hypothetical protein
MCPTSVGNPPTLGGGGCQNYTLLAQASETMSKGLQWAQMRIAVSAILSLKLLLSLGAGFIERSRRSG